MKIKSLFIYATLLALICSIIFFFVPNAIKLFSFSGISFFKGEVWRIITFTVTHISINHFIENIVAIGAVAFLSYEFGLRGKEFITYFFAISITVAIADAFLFPSLIIAGASLGLYGLIGVLSIRGSNFMPKLILIPLLGSSIFLKYVLTLLNCPSCSPNISQVLFHFSGFVVGICLVTLPKRFKSKRSILKEN